MSNNMRISSIANISIYVNEMTQQKKVNRTNQDAAHTTIERMFY